MPIVCDFQWVNGVGTGVGIGDNAIKPTWTADFNTGGRRRTGHAVLMFMVRGLTGGHSATVYVNDQVVGKIEPYEGANANYWFTQMINISGGPLRDGNNELRIDCAPQPDPEPNDIYDDFRVKNVLCFFQQEA